MNQLDVNTATVLSEEILRIQQELQKHGFVRTSDEELGILNMHQYIDEKFFTDELLGQELPSNLMPSDRMRVRDVIEYRRKPDRLVLTEHPVITMRPIPDAKINTPREYNRTHVLEHPKFVDWIKNMLSVIPREEQQTHGTMGFDFVRTFNQVAAYKHQDHEHFVIIYAAARETAGAVTSIHPIEHTEETTLAVALQPGEYLIFRDHDFMHDITPLQPRFEGDEQYRDTIVALIHYPTTYLNLDHQSHE